MTIKVNYSQNRLTLEAMKANKFTSRMEVIGLSGLHVHSKVEALSFMKFQLIAIAWDPKLNEKVDGQD